MRILMLTTKFSLKENETVLANDLVKTMVAQGHNVDVVSLDWNGMGQFKALRMYGGAAEVVAYPAFRLLPEWLPLIIRLALKWGFSSLFALRIARKFFGGRRYDLMLGFSPAITCFWLSLYFRKAAKTSRLILWDFFPFSHEDNGILPSCWPAHTFLKKAEEASISHYDKVGVLSPANLTFFKRHFPKSKVACDVVPLWGEAPQEKKFDRDRMRETLGIKPQQVACVFGGQFIPGRSIELLLAFAQKACEQHPSLLFLFAGKGPLLPDVMKYVNQCQGIKYLGCLNRAAYMDLLASADIGIVFTQAKVSVCPFPSKTIDYVRSRLPIWGAVEENGDYATIVQNEMKAGLVCPSSDLDCALTNLLRLAEDQELRNRLGENGHKYFIEHMTADKVLQKILPS